MDSPTKIRWGLGVAALAGVCFTATGAAFMWGHTGSDADLVHSYLLGVAGYIGTILAVFTGLLALPLGRLSREFPARMFWRTLLRPLPLVCLTGLIAEGAICFSATLGPRSVHPIIPLLYFAAASSFLVALVGYVLLISKASYAVALYGRFARRLVKRETCTLLRMRYIAYIGVTAPDRRLGTPAVIVRAMVKRLPSLLNECCRRRAPWSVFASVVRCIGFGCRLAVRDAVAKHRCDPGPPLVCELQLTDGRVHLLMIDSPATLRSFSVCGERTRRAIEDIGSIGRRGIRDGDLDLVAVSYGLLVDLGVTATNVRDHYDLEQDELVSALREQFSLAVAQGVDCADNRILPTVIDSASALANGILACAPAPTNSMAILSVTGFSAVFQGVTLSRVVQEDESRACWNAIDALGDLGSNLVQKGHRLSAYSIIGVLKETAMSYMLLTKAAPHRSYPDTLAAHALSNMLHIWAADFPNWTIWRNSSLSDKAAAAVKESAEFYISHRNDSIDAGALGELTHFGNIQHLQPTGSLFHPSSALSDALMDQNQNTEVLLRRLEYAAQKPSRFLIDLLQSATAKGKPNVAGQLASEVADIVLLYLAVLRKLERTVKAEGSERPVSRRLEDAIKHVSWFSSLATWRLADAFVAFLDCSSFGLTDFGDQLLRVTQACVFMRGCETDYKLAAAVDNVGGVLIAKGQSIIESRHGAPLVRLLAFWYARKLKPGNKHAGGLLNLAKQSVPSGTHVIDQEDFYPTNLLGGMWSPRPPNCNSPSQELRDGIAALLDAQELRTFRTDILKEEQK